MFSRVTCLPAAHLPADLTTRTGRVTLSVDRWFRWCGGAPQEGSGDILVDPITGWAFLPAGTVVETTARPYRMDPGGARIEWPSDAFDRLAAAIEELRRIERHGVPGPAALRRLSPTVRAKVENLPHWYRVVRGRVYMRDARDVWQVQA